MPANGDTNQRFGLYQNVCCSQKIIVREGAKFPDCKNHPNLPTLWKPVDLSKSTPLKAKKRIA